MAMCKGPGALFRPHPSHIHSACGTKGLLFLTLQTLDSYVIWISDHHPYSSIRAYPACMYCGQLRGGPAYFTTWGTMGKCWPVSLLKPHLPSLCGGDFRVPPWSCKSPMRACKIPPKFHKVPWGYRAIPPQPRSCYLFALLLQWWCP